MTRYKIREVTAPAYFQLDPTVHDVTLEYAGQIIKIAAYDKPANLKVTVTKTGNKQLLAGDSMRYQNGWPKITSGPGATRVIWCSLHLTRTAPWQK